MLIEIKVLCCLLRLVVSIVIDSSVASDFQCYIHIRPLAINIVGIEHFFASAFQNMALAAQLTIVFLCRDSA